MIFRKLFRIVLVGTSSFLWAQSPFINISQLPLLQSPSFAGSKYQHRLVLAGHYSQHPDFKNDALYLSYDNFLASKSIGLGFHYLGNRFGEKLNNENLSTFQNFFHIGQIDKVYPQEQQSHQFGICAAPRYNLGNPDPMQKHAYTLCPSLELGYSTDEQIINSVFLESYTKLIHTEDSSSIVKDSIFYVESRLRSQNLYTNVGLRLNSNNWILMYVFTYNYESLKERYHLRGGSLFTGGQSEQIYHRRYPFHQFLHRFAATYSFAKQTEAKYNMIIAGGIDISHYYHLQEPAQHQQFISEALKSKLNTPLWSGLYLSSTIRIQKILLGASFSRYKAQSLYGLSTGFQHRKGRFLITVAPNAGFKSIRTFETLLHIYF